MTAEDRLRALIGQLILDKCMLEAEVEKLRKAAADAAANDAAKVAPKEGA